MNMKRIVCFSLLAVAVFLKSDSLCAGERIRIVATTSTLASIAREIIGEKADIYYVASPKRNVHFIAPTPKDVLKVKKADALVHTGLDLEAWRNPLLDAAGNPNFLGEGKGVIDVSKGVSLLEVPTSLSRAEGDIHIYGNPHYWLDPENVKVIAGNIGTGLAKLMPQEVEELSQNTERFKQKIDVQMKSWLERMAPFHGASVVTYHKSWIYFIERFGLVEVGQLEPKPGIPPTAKHIAELIRIMKKKKVSVILKESFFENRTPAKISRETGAKVINLTQAVGELKEAQDYISMMEFNVSQLEEALSRRGGVTASARLKPGTGSNAS